MRTKITILAIAYIAMSGLLLAIAHQSSGPVTTEKTDRAGGADSGSVFLSERFAG